MRDDEWPKIIEKGLPAILPLLPKVVAQVPKAFLPVIFDVTRGRRIAGPPTRRVVTPVFPTPKPITPVKVAISFSFSCSTSLIT